MNQKSIIAILGVVVIILIGTTVYFATINSPAQPVVPAPKVVQQQVATPATAVQQPAQPTIPVAQPTDWKAYKNTKYGFELTFPTTWQGYKAVNRTLEWGTFGTSDSIDFGFNAQDSLASLFNVAVLSKSQWKKINAEDGPKPSYLGENSQYVFAYSSAQEAMGTILDRMKEIESIIKTFKITK